MSLGRSLFDAAEIDGLEDSTMPMESFDSQQTTVNVPANNAKGCSDEKPTAKALKQKLIKAGYRCELSGVRLSPETLSIDHAIPLSRGGTHSISNCELVHRIVNRMKGSMTNTEFIGWCRLVASNAMVDDHEEHF